MNVWVGLVKTLVQNDTTLWTRCNPKSKRNHKLGRNRPDKGHLQPDANFFYILGGAAI